MLFLSCHLVCFLSKSFACLELSGEGRLTGWRALRICLFMIPGTVAPHLVSPPMGSVDGTPILLLARQDRALQTKPSLQPREHNFKL